MTILQGQAVGWGCEPSRANELSTRMKLTFLGEEPQGAKEITKENYFKMHTFY